MAPAISARDSVALMVADRRGHLNYRCVWVLKVIGAESGLSNKEVAERVGGIKRGHISTVLARLKRLGLIENMEDDATPYVPNAWQLTSAGEELERAVRHETVRAMERDAGYRARGARSHRGAMGSGVGSIATDDGPSDACRERILAATVSLSCTDGVQSVSAERIARSARVSLEAFHLRFSDRDAALLAAFERELTQASGRARTAYEAQEGWLDGIRSGTLALLEFFDEQPASARLLVVHSAEGGSLLRNGRSEAVAQLVRVLDDERAPARRYPPSLAAEGVVGGVLGVIHGRLVKRDPGKLIDLLGPLMSMIVLPYLGTRAARRELLGGRGPSRRLPVEREAAMELLQGTSGRALKSQLTPRVLRVIAAEPGLSNVEIAQRAGVKDQGHMSRLLARLVRLGLAENRFDAGDSAASSNVWHLTGSGEQLERALRTEGARAGRSSKPPHAAVCETAKGVRSQS